MFPSAAPAARSNVHLTPKPSMTVVCALAEGSYFHGVAALVNSLIRADFRGEIAVGYRGAKPPWLKALEYSAADDFYRLSEYVRIRFTEVPDTWHLNNCKAHFIQQQFADTEAEIVYYFDADIVVTHRWQTFERWAKGGVVLVLDVADSYMSPYHVYRWGWQELAATLGLSCREFTGYVNGGCLGVSRAHAGFVDVWCKLMEALEHDGADMTKMKNSTGKPEFSRMDQDVLNATLMATDQPISLLGPEAMGAYPWVGAVMPHAMFHKKPWRRNYIIDALRGFPPGRTHLAYWQFVAGPIRPFGAFELFRKKIQLKIGRLISLVHSRSYRDI